jgi:cytochrome d ubiquinol oxidase subunit II
VTQAIAAITFAGVVLYALLGGADYGAGVWDLLAGTGEAGAERRH